MGIISKLSELFGNDIGIDLGSSMTRVWVKGKGLVLDEPSVACVSARGKRFIAASRYVFSDPPWNVVTTVRPIKEGVISDYDMALPMIKEFVDRACPRRFWEKLAKNRRRFVVSVPGDITEEEKKILETNVRLASWIGEKTAEDIDAKVAMKQLSSIRMFPIEATMAAAIGAGLPVSEPQGSMVVDIGSGRCDVAIISLGGIVHSCSVRGAGDEDMDNAICTYMRDRHGLLISDGWAECIKKEIGSAYPTCSKLEIDGRNAATRVPKSVTVTSEEICEALKAPVNRIVEAVKATLNKCEPELAADLVDRGFVLTGGGSLLPGLNRRLSAATGLPVRVAEDPAHATIRGVAAVLDEIDFLEKADNGKGVQIPLELFPCKPETFDRNKTKGMLWGLIVGDAFGSPTRSCDKDDHPWAAEMERCSVSDQPCGYWTYAASMAMCVMDSFVRKGDYDLKDVAETFAKCMKEGYQSSIDGLALGEGRTTEASLTVFARTGGSFVDGRKASKGNGSIVRFAPSYAIARALGRPEIIHEVSDLTHASAVAREVCDTFAGVLEDHLCYRRTKTGPGKELSRTLVNNSGWAASTLQAALWAFHATDSFEEGLIVAVNLGGDSDAIGAVYGQIAGAYYGFDAIPERWIKAVKAWKKVDALIERFLGMFEPLWRQDEERRSSDPVDGVV